MAPDGPSGNATPPAPAPTAPERNGTSPTGNSTALADDTASNLTLALVPDAATYSLGDPVTFVLTLRNVGTGNETVTIRGCDPWLFVQNESGAEVYNSSAGMCPMIVVPVVLGPGQAWSRAMSWDGLTSSGSAVPAGTYRLCEDWDAAPDAFLSASATVQIVAS